MHRFCASAFVALAACIQPAPATPNGAAEENAAEENATEGGTTTAADATGETGLIGPTGPTTVIAPPDETPPAVTLTAQGTSPHYDASVHLQGQCEDGLPVDVHDDSALITSITCAGGSFDALIMLPLVDGPHHLTVSQIDAAANVGTADTTLTLALKALRCEDGTCDADEAATCLRDCQPPPRDLQVPNLAIVMQDNSFHQYFQDVSQGPTTWTFDDASVHAVITAVGGGEWALTLDAKAPVKTVMFPWRVNNYSVNGSIADDRVYHAYLGGVVEPENARGAYAWWGLEYPGTSFSPFIVIADSEWAQLVAAVNWPPRNVTPMHAAQQTMISYNQPLGTGESQTYRTLLVELKGDPIAGYAPWQLAVSKYKEWLEAHLALPPPPQWMRDNEGYYATGLQNFTAYSQPYLATQWAQVQDIFGWLQLWGQMSNYSGDPMYASPPLMPSEPVGCCLPSSTMHTRYLPTLVDFVNAETAAGRHVGYYAREPASNHLDVPADAQFTTDWLAKNKNTYGANAFYIDVVGRGPMGDAAAVSDLMKSAAIPDGTLIEGFVDVYRPASLMSGYITGGSWPGGPGYDPTTCPKCTFINLARLTMGNRLGYYGHANGEHVLHGPLASSPYWGERHMFLLGLKADCWAPNQLYRDIAALRSQVQWWQREPTYLDTMGLTGVPAGIEARRFRDKNGVTLITIDNPQGLAGQSLNLKGRPLAIPAATLSILEVVR